ncbi:MAG: hypothetical protein SPL02_01530, partial [Bacilli bacterium]|nr:hypothetical protein [Bacilli bacterium]MDY6430639.1 hypothetical protein [Bacilli bacterium]
KYDMYIQLSMGNDKLYIGYASGEEQQSSEVPVVTDSEEPVEAVYQVEINGVAYEMAEGTIDYPETQDLAMSYAASVKAGDKFSFLVNGVAVAAWSNPEDAKNINNISGSRDEAKTEYEIHNDAEAVFYFNHWIESGNYTFWVTGYVAGEEESSQESSEASGKKYDITEKYGVVIDGVCYDTVHQGENWEGYDEYVAFGVTAHEGDLLSLYDSSTDVEWSNVTMNTYSTGFAQVGDEVYCTEDGEYDIYIQLKWEADRVYIGPHK